MLALEKSLKPPKPVNKKPLVTKEMIRQQMEIRKDEIKSKVQTKLEQMIAKEEMLALQKPQKKRKKRSDSESDEFKSPRIGYVTLSPLTE